jgi:hypothetical protein
MQGRRSLFILQWIIISCCFLDGVQSFLPSAYHSRASIMGATPNFRILPQWTQTRSIQTVRQAFVEEMQDDDEVQFEALAARAQEEKQTIISGAAAANADAVRVGDKMELPTPNQILTAKDVVTVCMDSLVNNNDPRENAGLEVNFNFSSDRCRAALGGELDKFIVYASNPTFGSMIYARK